MVSFWLIHMAVSFASTVGFGVITNIPPRTLLPAGLVGAVAWSVYVEANLLVSGVIVPNLLAAVVIGGLGNVLARVVQAPVNLFYIPSLVSLVPGALIFESMKDFTLGQTGAAQGHLIDTLTIAMALAAGFVIAEAVVSGITHWLNERSHTCKIH